MVNEAGAACGMISGGCAEQSIITQAGLLMQDAHNQIIRYGAGSPYMDIKLPCGAGIDVFFETRHAATLIREFYHAHSARKPLIMGVDKTVMQSRIITADEKPHFDFTKTYPPPFHIHAFGNGVNLASFSAVAHAAGFEIIAYTPEAAQMDMLAALGAQPRHITHRQKFAPDAFDAHSAVVTLFHEHEWEIPILHAALNSKCAYIGALGSRATHAARLADLAVQAPTRRQADEIFAPVGLSIGARNPREIAVAIMAQLINIIDAQK